MAHTVHNLCVNKIHDLMNVILHLLDRLIEKINALQDSILEFDVHNRTHLNP